MSATTDGDAQLAVVRSKENYLEVMNPHASKGGALFKAASARGFDMVDVIAFGNGENDISMLRAAGTGIAVANAEAAVKAVADEICASNEEDGVARWIEAHLL